MLQHEPCCNRAATALGNVTSRPKPETLILTALELTFCDAIGRRIGFRDAVTRWSSGDWSLLPHARATFQNQGA